MEAPITSSMKTKQCLPESSCVDDDTRDINEETNQQLLCTFDGSVDRHGNPSIKAVSGGWGVGSLVLSKIYYYRTFMRTFLLRSSSAFIQGSSITIASELKCGCSKPSSLKPGILRCWGELSDVHDRNSPARQCGSSQQCKQMDRDVEHFLPCRCFSQ